MEEAPWNQTTRSADTAAAEEFLPKFQELVETEGYCAEQIFNADETALFFKMLPDKTLAEKDDKVAKKGYKQIIDRITLLFFACNWAGTMKMRPLAIGKFRAPRCFHHVNMNTLPVQYDFSKNAWMTSSIFKTWFHKTFVPTVRRHLRALGLEEKACLLMDICPAYSSEDLLRSAEIREIRGDPCVLPTPRHIIQPLDQGAISAFKKLFRRDLIKAVVAEDGDITEFVKKMTLKGAFYIVSSAWNAVKTTSIKACWDKALGNPFDRPIPNDDEDEFEGFTPEEVKQVEEKLSKLTPDQSLRQLIHVWADIEVNSPVAEMKSGDDIMADILQEEQDECDEQEDGESEDSVPAIANSQAVQATQLLMDSYE